MVRILLTVSVICDNYLRKRKGGLRHLGGQVQFQSSTGNIKRPILLFEGCIAALGEPLVWIFQFSLLCWCALVLDESLSPGLGLCTVGQSSRGWPMLAPHIISQVLLGYDSECFIELENWESLLPPVEIVKPENSKEMFFKGKEIENELLTNKT